MPISTIEYKGEIYPAFQSTGFAARFVIPFAQEVCKGNGVDIGCGRIEWCFPGARPVDPVLGFWDATSFIDKDLDYIFSSHCLEHVPNWVDALNYWYDKLKPGGVLFLYLPDFTQHYWRPWNNRKHIHAFTPEIIAEYLMDKGYAKVFVSQVDLNHSFTCICEK